MWTPLIRLSLAKKSTHSQCFSQLNLTGHVLKTIKTDNY